MKSPSKFCDVTWPSSHFIGRFLHCTLKAETFAGRNFCESPKSRNFANLSFANFILWRKFTEKTFAILWKSSFLDGDNFREWLGKVNNNHFKSQFKFFSSIEKWHAHTACRIKITWITWNEVWSHDKCTVNIDSVRIDNTPPRIGSPYLYWACIWLRGWRWPYFWFHNGLASLENKKRKRKSSSHETAGNGSRDIREMKLYYYLVTY